MNVCFSCLFFSGSSFLFGAREEPCAAFVSIVFSDSLLCTALLLWLYLVCKLLFNIHCVSKKVPTFQLSVTVKS